MLMCVNLFIGFEVVRSLVIPAMNIEYIASEIERIPTLGLSDGCRSLFLSLLQST